MYIRPPDAARPFFLGLRFLGGLLRHTAGRRYIAPSGPTRTTEGSAVVAIGVDRRGVGRHNSCVSATHSQEELHPTLTCMEL